MGNIWRIYQIVVYLHKMKAMNKETTPGSETVADRIRYLIIKSRLTQSEFAKRLGIDPSNLSKHLSGKLPITDILINRIVVNMGVSKQWLVDGSDVPFSKAAGIPGIIPPAGQLANAVSVPVYDIDVTAGSSNLDAMFTDERITGYIALPRISSDSLIVHVSGDSMQPEIINGGMIAIRPVDNLSTILWGQIYVVVTEDFRRVKYLRRDPSNPDNVILHSANPDYDDVVIPRSDIRSLFRVEAVLNYKVLG